MTVDAAHLGIVGRIAVTVCALVPFAFVLAAVNGEMFAIVVKGGGHPGRLTVAGGAIVGKLGCPVIRIPGLVIICLMTADTGVGRIVVVLIVAAPAVVLDRSMSALQDVELIMDVKSRRTPAGSRRMATDAIGGNAQLQVSGILTLFEIRLVTIETNGGSALESRSMALQTVCALMSAGQWECRRVMVKLKI